MIGDAQLRYRPPSHLAGSGRVCRHGIPNLHIGIMRPSLICDNTRAIWCGNAGGVDGCERDRLSHANHRGDGSQHGIGHHPRGSAYVCCGERSAQAPATIDEHTVFDAASLSKPVFAHAVLQLLDQGRLSLDAPLGSYLPNYVPSDDRVSSITARQVLSHSGGFPNWRNSDVPLKTYFQPGERFSYSGEGFLYLQKAVEAITGEKLHVLAARLVLQPFEMTRSSFIWDWSFDQNRAYPHDAFGRPALGSKPGEGNAAGSLQTTAADFARFLLSALDGARLRPETA